MNIITIIKKRMLGPLMAGVLELRKSMHALQRPLIDLIEGKPSQSSYPETHKSSNETFNGL